MLQDGRRAETASCIVRCDSSAPPPSSESARPEPARPGQTGSGPDRAGPFNPCNCTPSPLSLPLPCLQAAAAAEEERARARDARAVPCPPSLNAFAARLPHSLLLHFVRVCFCFSNLSNVLVLCRRLHGCASGQSVLHRLIAAYDECSIITCILGGSLAGPMKRRTSSCI